MNTSTKVFATLALSAAVGEKIKNTEIGELAEAGEKLRFAGFIATRAYPSAPLTKKKTEAIAGAVMRLLSKPLQPYDILSMLVAGLIDIRAKCKQERYMLIDPVVDAAQECLDLYEGNGPSIILVAHVAAYERYCAWLES